MHVATGSVNKRAGQSTMNDGVVVQHTDKMMASGLAGRSCLFPETLTPLCWLTRAAAGISLGHVVPSRSVARLVEFATTGSLYLEVLASG